MPMKSKHVRRTPNQAYPRLNKCGAGRPKIPVIHEEFVMSPDAPLLHSMRYRARSRQAAHPQSEGVPLCVRQLSTTALLALRLIPGLLATPRLSRDRNGRGRGYTRLRYRSAPGLWRSLYIGDLNTKSEMLLRETITRRWPVTRSELCRTIRMSRARLRLVRELARGLAECSGCRFHGWLLRTPHKGVNHGKELHHPLGR